MTQHQMQWNTGTIPVNSGYVDNQEMSEITVSL